MEEVYIVQAYRTAVAKAKKGKLRFIRPDDLGASLINEITKKIPNLNKENINDIIIGNATPEAEQGLNIGRMILINRIKYCQSTRNDRQSLLLIRS